jgi:hypothetical protein
MVIFLTALLASSKLMPLVDREALDLQARAEALQPRTHISRPAPTPARTQNVRRTATRTAQPVLRPGPSRAQPVQQAQAPTRRPATRRASGGNALDFAQITTICRAAGEQEDPAAFIGRLSSAYALSADDSVSLRSSCAAYLAGRADARRSGGTY